MVTESETSDTRENLVLDGIRELARGNEVGALEAFARSLVGTEEDPATRALCAARLCLLQGQPEKAVGHLEDLVDWDPENPVAHEMLGAACLACHDTLRAIACYRRALEIEPRDERVQSALSALVDVDEP